MIVFLLKGLLRDRSRSFFPLIVIIAGVTLTVVLFCWIRGMFDNIIQSNASFQTGHLKVSTQPYLRESEQLPNDLALTGLDTVLGALQESYPDLIWTPRIRFGGLIDVPDSNGETRAQGPALGVAVGLYGNNQLEQRLLNLREALQTGTIPDSPDEILISQRFAGQLQVAPGDTVTLIGSTMFGSMATRNFVVSGTIHFGIAALDRGAFVVNIQDVQQTLDMQNTAGEILGFFRSGYYDESRSNHIRDVYNTAQPDDEFAPYMQTLREQNGLAEVLDTAGFMLGIIVFLFIFIMFIVLWNAGLMGSIRRYGEIGIRLAIGEPRSHLYSSMLAEAFILGLAGSLAGTLAGLGISWYLQEQGLDVSFMLKNSAVMLSSVLRSRITPAAYGIGFIPGVAATLLGTAAAGIGIYRRQTAHLFKEFE